MNKEVKVRESNLELLRIVCMLYIILLHFLGHGLGALYGDFSFITFFNSFFLVAVNCFILVSGYFGIKATWKGFFHLYLMCVCYDIISIIILSFFGEFHFKEIIYSFFPFSHSGTLWFISDYIYLFLLSPMLNRIVDNISKKDFLIILLIWSVLTFYFGFFWYGSFNVNHGCSFVNFLFLYLIGRFISKYTKDIKTPRRSKTYFGLYLFCSLLIAGALLIYVSESKIYFRTLIGRIHAYNSPLVIVSSIFFFLFFRSLSVKSKTVNWLASSVLAAYLIHEGRLRNIIYEFIEKIGCQVNNGLLLGIYIFLIALLFLIICILIEKCRMIITNPVERLLNRIKWDDYVDKLIDKLGGIIK